MARIPYLEQSDLPDEYQDLVLSLEKPGKVVNPFQALAHNPPILEKLRPYQVAVKGHNGLPDRQWELVILATARETDTKYPWNFHVEPGLEAGLTKEEILAVSRGDIEALDKEDAVLVSYTLAAISNEVTDDLHQEMEQRFEYSQIVGTVTLANAFLAVCNIFDALGIELDEGDEFVGWELENLSTA